MDGNSELNEQIINARKSMHKLVDNIISLKIDEIENYDFPLDYPFGLEVIYKETLFYLIIRFSSNNKNFICLGSGAFDRDKYDSNGELIRPPFFARWSWHKYFDESVISYADPMIFKDEEIKLGWFIGDSDHWYVETLSTIIQKLAKNQEVINDNILFFGSSGGGFVSTCLGTLIKNSEVLINNSQLFVLNYYKTLTEKALDLISPTFENKEEMIEQIEYRLDVIKLFEKENYAPNITYYINVNSKQDLRNQNLPFLQKYYNQENISRLKVIYYKDDENPKPHNPLPNKMTQEIIKLFAKNYLYNDEPASTRIMLKSAKYTKQLETENSTMKKQLNKTDEKLNKTTKELDKLKKSEKTLKQKNKMLTDERNALNHEINEMKTSTSWKVTKPFRKIMNLLKKN